MRRFVVFPLALGICGAFLPVISWGEGVIAQWPVFSVGPFPSIFELAKDVFSATMPYGVATGITAGIGLAMWDKFRNPTRQNSGQLLLANLFWCLFYASLVVAINCAICAITLLLTVDFTRSPFASSTLLMQSLTAVFIVHTLLNFTAIMWAAIRSITTNDILTPRVLREKLRERARLG